MILHAMRFIAQIRNSRDRLIECRAGENARNRKIKVIDCWHCIAVSAFFGGTILKHVIIAEKPSVANEYAKVLGVTIKARDIMKMINGLLLGR